MIDGVNVEKFLRKRNSCERLTNRKRSPLFREISNKTSIQQFIQPVLQFVPYALQRQPLRMYYCTSNKNTANSGIN